MKFQKINPKNYICTYVIQNIQFSFIILIILQISLLSRIRIDWFYPFQVG